MDRTVTTVIDADRCTGCGLCVAVCPKGTLSLDDGIARVSGSESMNCGHCAAVCPTGAVRVKGIDPALSVYANFETGDDWVPFGGFDTGDLVRLMRSRRSCRSFMETPVTRSVLEDLVKIGITAPSGSNAQLWSFTILPDRGSVAALGKRIGDFFIRLNRLAGKAWLRTALKWLGRPELARYYDGYYQGVRTALERWASHGEDRLFHGAPALIVAGSRNDASCPAEDALLATQNMLLGAHCMGLGTCLVGYAVEVLRRDRNLRRFIGLPDDETPYAVVALGYPNETYTSLTGRCRAAVRYFEAERGAGAER